MALVTTLLCGAIVARGGDSMSDVSMKCVSASREEEQRRPGAEGRPSRGPRGEVNES